MAERDDVRKNEGYEDALPDPAEGKLGRRDTGTEAGGADSAPFETVPSGEKKAAAQAPPEAGKAPPARRT